MHKCCLCGEECHKDMIREDLRKGTEYYFCGYHFNRYMFTDKKKIRELIKLAKRPIDI